MMRLHLVKVFPGDTFQYGSTRELCEHVDGQ
jgi:hypothetical protein